MTVKLYWEKRQFFAAALTVLPIILAIVYFHLGGEKASNTYIVVILISTVLGFATLYIDFAGVWAIVSFIAHVITLYICWGTPTPPEIPYLMIMSVVGVTGIAIFSGD